MKRSLLTALQLLICTFLISAGGHPAPSASVLHIKSVETDSEGNMTDDEFKAYEDSLLRALYPPAIYYNYLDSIQGYSEDIPVGDSNIGVLPDTTGFGPLIPIYVGVDRNLSVGEIPITSGTTPTGGRTYEVPIRIYPGINDFQPKLSLVYNSQTSSSIVGHGWNLSGLSVIARGGKSIYYDGKNDGLKMDLTDSFYLDGNRLIALSTLQDGYILYQSEQGNIKVKGYADGLTMKYFKVFYPDGSTAVFGNETNVNNKVQYPVTEAYDRYGNKIRYSYTSVYNVDRITYIYYGNARIWFKYENRVDPIIDYLGDNLRSLNTRINEIVCYNGTKQLWKYGLEYSDTHDISLLTKITHTSGDEEYNPLVFKYGILTDPIGFGQSSTNLVSGYDTEYGNSLRTLRGKFEYDNAQDGIIVFPNCNPYWYHYKKDWLIESEENYLINQYPENQKILVYTSLSEVFALPQTDILTGKGFIDILCADLEGRQKESVIKVNNISTGLKETLTFSVYKPISYGSLAQAYTRVYTLNTADVDLNGNSSIQPKYYYVGDFDGDGKQEVFAVGADCYQNKMLMYTQCYLFDLENNKILYKGRAFDYNVCLIGTENTDAWKCANSSDKLVVFDADGDGKTDICLINGTGMHLYTFSKTSDGTYQLTEFSNSTSPNRSELNNKDLLLGEFNGDNLVDLLISPVKGSSTSAQSWTIYYSHGNGKFTSAAFSGPSKSDSNDYNGFFTHDVDGDGKSDLIYYDDKKFTSRTSKANTPTGQLSILHYSKSGSILVPTNINSHNRFTTLISLNKGTAVKYNYLADKSRECLLTGVKGSYDVQEMNEYRSLNDANGNSSFYTMGHDAVYPYVNIREPLMVLSRNITCLENSVYIDNQFEIYDETRYEYENAVFHRHGLGFRGFSKVTVYDKYDRPTVCTFDPYNHSVMTGKTTPSSESTYNYTVNVAANKLKKVLLNSKTEKNLLTGYTSDHNYTYNSYCQPISETIAYSDGISVKKETTYAAYTDLETAYRLDMVTDNKETTTRESDTYTERIAATAYTVKDITIAKKYINGNQAKETRYEYDVNGNVTKRTEKPYTQTVGLTTIYEYNTDGLLSAETDPYGLSKTYTYDIAGRVSEMTDYTGSTEYLYDGQGRLVEQNNPDGTQKKILYEWLPVFSRGIYKVTTEETGKATTAEWYNALGWVVRETDMRFDGRTRNIDTDYDLRGNVIRKSEPFFGSSASKWITYTYDSFDRPLSITEPSGRKTTYSYAGSNTITVENGVAIGRKYDSSGQLILSSDAAGEVQYNLAADGQPKTIISPGGIYYWYFYDKYRRQDHVEDASAGVISYKYDSWGNISERTSAGKTMSYEYDALNRLSKTVTPEFTTTYTYDSKNRLSKVSSTNGTSKTFIYDSYGRVGELLVTGGSGRSLRKTYSYSQGNISSILYDAAGIRQSESYSYSNGTFINGTFKSKTIYNLVEENEYGQPVKIETGGITRNYTYDNHLPAGRTAKYGNRWLKKENYEFDPLSCNLLSREDELHDNSEDFEYDVLNRLVKAGSNTYSYNSQGNITEKSDVGKFEYSIPNKPHAITDIEPYGNNLPSETQTITYASFSRPVNIVEGAYTATFTYNADGDRVKMDLKKNGVSQLTRYYLGDCYEFEDTPESTLIKLYLFGNYYDAPAVFVSDNEGSEDIHYILRDYLGSITHVVDDKGNIVQETSFDAWGNMRDPATWEVYGRGNEPELFLGRGYTGHEHLPAFGLINMNARLYDPLTSRFLSPDPYVQLPDYTQGLNRFTYAMNNPLCYIDENGEFFWAVVGVAAVISGVINVATHWDAVKAGGFWTGAKYFGVGALAGGAGAAMGMGVAVGFGNMLGITAAVYSATATGFIPGAMMGMAEGATGGFLLETGNSLIEGKNFRRSLLNGLQGALSGGISGGITGGIAGGFKAYAEGSNFWTGKANFSGYYGFDKFGNVKYVGITGRDPEIRFHEHHISGTNRAGLHYKVQMKFQTKLEARIWEQNNINHFGMEKFGGQLFNLRNEISPKYWHIHSISQAGFSTNSTINKIHYRLWRNELLRK